MRYSRPFVHPFIVDAYLFGLGIVLANAEGRETKKRTTLARLLKGLKTVNRRDRTNNQNTQTQVRVSKNTSHFPY